MEKRIMNQGCLRQLAVWLAAAARQQYGAPIDQGWALPQSFSGTTVAVMQDRSSLVLFAPPAESGWLADATGAILVDGRPSPLLVLTYDVFVIFVIPVNILYAIQSKEIVMQSISRDVPDKRLPLRYYPVNQLENCQLLGPHFRFYPFGFKGHEFWGE